MKPGKLTLPQLAAMKSRGEKIVMVTAYDARGRGSRSRRASTSCLSAIRPEWSCLDTTAPFP